MRTYDYSSAIAADKRHLIHPLQHPTAHEAPRVWVKGEGEIITDSEGQEFIDGLSGLWNVNIGHGQKELADAAHRQLKTLAYASNYVGNSNLGVIELGERLAERAYPCINHFFFTSGGAESTESAIKTTRFYWKSQGKPDKTHIISRKFGYHGVTLAAMSATGLDIYWPMFEPRVPGFSHIESPYPYFFNYKFQPTPEAPTPGIAAANLLEAEILRIGPDKVGGFIAEPVQGAGGVIVPQEDYFTRIREICDTYEVLLIADEVITGFGRTGKWFALEHWGIQPDIINFAKGITSGYLPMGGIGVHDKINAAIAAADPAKRYMHAFTYSGHPTCAAVALANLDYMERENLVDRVKETGDYFLRCLKELEAHPHVGEARGLGLMAALEIVEDSATCKPFDPERKIGDQINAEVIKRGVWSRTRGDVYCLAPPFTSGRDVIDRIVAAMDGAIRVVLGN